MAQLSRKTRRNKGPSKQQHHAQPRAKCGGATDVGQRSDVFACRSGVDRDLYLGFDRGPVGLEGEDPTRTIRASSVAIAIAVELENTALSLRTARMPERST